MRTAEQPATGRRYVVWLPTRFSWELEGERATLSAAVSLQHEQIQAMKATRAWRLAGGYWRVRDQIRGGRGDVHT